MQKDFSESTPISQVRAEFKLCEVKIQTNRNVSVFKHSNENNFDWNYSLAGFVSQTLHHFARKEEPDLLASSKFHSLFSFFMWSEIRKVSME